MPSVRHLVLTRFAEKIQKADGVAFDQQAPLSPEWLAYRFSLFEQYLLPSMQAQTFGAFEWRIFVHPGFDEALSDRLRAYDSRIVVVPTPVTPLHDLSGVVASTRIDSDDGFASNALEVVNQYAERFAAGTERTRLLRLKQGWWLNHQTRQVYQQRGWSFLTLLERQSTYFGAMVCSCDDIAKRYPGEWIETVPLWLRVVHGGNVRNRWDRTKHAIPVDTIRRAGFEWMGGPVATPQPVSAPSVPDPTPHVLPRLALIMRSSDRRRAERPVRDNYVRRTVAKLVGQGVSDLLIHVSKVTDGSWIATELGPDLLDKVRVVVPDHNLSPNATALAGLAAVDLEAVEWVVLLEDDLDFCRDFVPSVQRWLMKYGRADRNVFRFFGFFAPPNKSVRAFDHPLSKLRASQAIALRREDAKDFLAWGRENLPTWRGRGPLAAKPGIAFDKFVAAWAQSRWPGRPGVLSWPFFVDHIGAQSSLHVIGGMNHAGFAGRHWSFGASA